MARSLVHSVKLSSFVILEILFQGLALGGAPNPDQRLQQVGICGTCAIRMDEQARPRYSCADGDNAACFTSAGTCTVHLTLQVADTTVHADPQVPCSGNGSSSQVTLQLSAATPAGSTAVLTDGPTGNCDGAWSAFACPDGTPNTFFCSRTQERLTEAVIPSFAVADLRFQRLDAGTLAEQLRQVCGVPVGTPMVMSATDVTKTPNVDDDQPSVLEACLTVYFDALQ